MFDWIKRLFNKEKSVTTTPSETEQKEMKFLIVGIGNIGRDYEGTRHNVGFEVADAIAAKCNAQFNQGNSADFCEIKHKGRSIILIKPTTYVNLSGKAVNHFMVKNKIPKENILIVLDDLNLDFGIIRLRDKGSDGGHNGLKNIDQVLGGNDYARLRIGIGSKFHKGHQVNYVLGKWNKEEKAELDQIVEKAAEACLSFCTIGIKHTVAQFNGKKV